MTLGRLERAQVFPNVVDLDDHPRRAVRSGRVLADRDVSELCVCRRDVEGAIAFTRREADLPYYVSPQRERLVAAAAFLAVDHPPVALSAAHRALPGTAQTPEELPRFAA